MYVLLFVVKMPTKIFVGNLAYGVTSDVIRALFEHYGAVTECDVLGNFGFVVSSYIIIYNGLILHCRSVITLQLRTCMYSFCTGVNIIHICSLCFASNLLGIGAPAKFVSKS